MPKIFLIKNRLHQQQLRLQEQQNGGKNDLGIGSAGDAGAGSPQPLSLIVERKEEGKETPEIPTVDPERNRGRSASGANRCSTGRKSTVSGLWCRVHAFRYFENSYFS